jgi:cyanophycin synthetase
VPEEGRRVKLRVIEASQWGGEIENLTSRIHPDNARLAIELTRYVGLTICGVDLITTDITKPWHETGGVINELNFGPDFRWYGREEDAAKIVGALVEGDGRIPVHLVTGKGDVLAQARNLKAELSREGLKCHLTTADYTEDGDGGELRMAVNTLFGRSLAMTMRLEVDGLIIAGREAELLRHGFAVDRFESVSVVNEDRQDAEKTLRMLQSHVEMRSHRLMNS